MICILTDSVLKSFKLFFFFQAEDGIRDGHVTGVQTCALPISARYTHGNNMLEALWTTATALLFIGLMLTGSRIWAAVHFDGPPPDSMRIEVLSKQFAWSFRYAGPDGKFGRTDIKLINDQGGNPFGIDD